MFDIGFSELLIIGIVALIVVGPKDLPGMFHTLGRFTARARQLGREFSRAMESAAKESGVDDVAKDLRNVTSPKSMGLDALKDAADKFESWKPGQHGGNTGPNAPKAKSGLSEERAQAAKTINEAAAAKAQARLDAEAAAEAASWDAQDAPSEPAKTPAAKKPAAKKPAAKKPAAKKPAAKKPAAKKPAAPRKRAPAKKATPSPEGDA